MLRSIISSSGRRRIAPSSLRHVCTTPFLSESRKVKVKGVFTGNKTESPESPQSFTLLHFAEEMRQTRNLGTLKQFEVGRSSEATSADAFEKQEEAIIQYLGGIDPTGENIQSSHKKDAAEQCNCTVVDVENTLAKFPWAKQEQVKLEKPEEEGKPIPKSMAETAALDQPPRLSSSAQVTIAVPCLHEPNLNHQIPPEMSKKPPPPDESRKLFQRIWTEDDEIELLQGFFDYTTHPNRSSHHLHATKDFYDQIRSKFQLDFNKKQLSRKLRGLKKKYRNVVSKFSTGKEYKFKSPHEQATFEIASKIWGNVAVNGASANHALPAPIDEDDDAVNNPNFNNSVDCQSPNPNGIDISSKTPRSRKRNRAEAVKMEEKQFNTPPNVNISNAQPVSDMAAPAIGLGITGSLSGVIEDTVKSCLSPILNDIFCYSMNYSKGSCCVNGVGLGRSPKPPMCFGATISGDKVWKERWRKQQILELEVISKRLELMQDEIDEQVQELRSMGK